jgi:hypothetical protein
MTLVLFELGARPYPPRDLYRAYLEQSDVFIGIYAASYGWVAPGMEVSGLEDEYRLSAGMVVAAIYGNRPEPIPFLHILAVSDHDVRGERGPLT